MDETRAFVGTTVGVGLIALVHALLTWPIAATAALFGGGAAVAFVAEVVAVNGGWLTHHRKPQLLGVPLYVLPGWTGTIYVAFRLASLVLAGWPAVLGAAVLATASDVVLDPGGVARGHWSYDTSTPGPRYRGVPWWNFAGWLLVSAVTAALAVPFLP